VDCAEFSAMGHAVETLFWKEGLNPKNQTKLKCHLQKKNAPVFNLRDDVGQDWKQGEKLAELTDLGKILNGNDVAVRMKSGASAIDFAGPGRRVYQVTVSDHHRMSLLGMICILLQGGYLVECQGGAVEMNPNPPTEKLKFYWVVPEGVQETWGSKRAFAYQETDSKKLGALEIKNKKVVTGCMAIYVEQYVLIMEKERV
jgi:hypothetical protein